MSGSADRLQAIANGTLMDLLPRKLLIDAESRFTEVG